MELIKSLLAFAAFFTLVTSFPSSGEDVSGLIVNGRPADIADFPHKLALYDRGRFFCGAAIIDRLHALTAAHCLDLQTPPEFIDLYGGSTSRVSGGHLFFAQEYHLHEQYRQIPLSTGQVIWDYDIAIIRVLPTTPLEGFPNVQPTILPAPCATACCGVCAGVEISLAGWGLLADGTLPIYLERLEQTVIPFAECQSNHWEGQITDRMFCVTADFYDSCNGDSGSAILLESLQHQVGYVSFGSIHCGDGSAPAVYGRIEHPEIRSFITRISGL